MSSFPRTYKPQPQRRFREISCPLDFTPNSAMRSPYPIQQHIHRESGQQGAREGTPALSLTTELKAPTCSRLSSLSPTDIAPRQHSTPVSVTSSTMVLSPKQPRFVRESSHRSNTSPVSPEPLTTDSEVSQTSVEPRSSRSELVTPVSVRSKLNTQRTVSAETVRGPMRDREPAPSRLTPFPPWVNDSGEAGLQHQGRDQGRHSALSVIGFEGRWLLNCIVHAMVLAIQFVVTLAVFSALMWIAIWQKSEEDVEFWEWLWKFAEPSLVGILLVCSISLLIHEVRILSSVALLYLQSAILVLNTIASVFLWVRCIREYNSPVKGMLMGCNILMWGLSLFGFTRAVVIWKVETEIDEERMSLYGNRESRSGSYGTFMPWCETCRDPRGSL